MDYESTVKFWNDVFISIHLEHKPREFHNIRGLTASWTTIRNYPRADVDLHQVVMESYHTQ